MANTAHIRHSENFTNGENMVVRSIRDVAVTEERRPYMNVDDSGLQHAGTARANLAPSVEAPHGTTQNDWAKKHSHQTVLQQHCDFFDRDHDGVLWPQDTFVGFHRLGFGVILSLVAVFVIHDKHGSDTGTYDHEGRFVPQRFEDIFAKYAAGRDYLTIWDLSNVLEGQRCIADPIGWGGALFEWLATYLMLWPEDGRMLKEDIRGIYDGSIFYTLAARRTKGQ